MSDSHLHALRSRWLLLVFLVLLGAVVLTLVQVEEASAAVGATVNGRVTFADTGGGVTGVTVKLYQNSGPDWIFVTSAVANVDGYFQFTNVSSGSYRAWVDSGIPAGYQQGWRVFYCDGATTVNGVAVLLAPTVAADAFEDDDNRVQATPTTPDATQLHSMYASGEEDWIRFDVVAGHTYVIETDAPWNAQPDTSPDTILQLIRPMGGWLETIDENDDQWMSKYSQMIYVAEATGERYARVTANAGATGWYKLIVRDVTPEIAGKVTSTANGLPVEGIEVRAWYYDDWASTYFFRGSDLTDANGRYALVDLIEDEYVLEFHDPSTEDGFYLDEYYHDDTYIYDANSIAITPGVTTTINESLTPSPPSISGTVTEAGTGDPVANVLVGAYYWDAGWWPARWAWTDANGEYEFHGLGNAEIIVLFGDEYDDDWPYELEWWDDSSTQGGAETIYTVYGSEVSGIDAQLGPRTPSITGTLTDETTGDPVGAIRVSSSVWNGASWDSGPTVYSGEDGVYRIYDLMPGSYRVDFYDLWSWDGFYDYEAWDDHDSWLDADTITFTGTTFVADAELSPGSPDITGRVTDEDTGDPIPGISVTTYYWNITHWEEYQYDSTDENGDYAIYGLPQGMQARIGFKDYGAQNGSYRAEFWDDAATVDTADGLLMEDSFGWPYSGIDAQLTPGDPSIIGTVTDAISGDPIEGATVYLWEFLGIGDPIGEWAIDAMSTYADGTYAFCDLPAGTYWVEFEKPGYAYGRADSVTDPVLETVDWAMMPIDADVGGVVRDAVTGHTIAGANLELMLFDGTEFYSVDGATTGGGGGYRFDDVRHGGYKIVAWAFGYEDLETYVEFDGSPVVVNPLLAPVPADAPVRVADRTRFSTAVDIARMAFDDDGDPSNGTQWENVDHVVIASGDDRAAADPLAASGLCGLYDAPLFLVSAKDVPAEVEAAVHEIVDQGDAVTVHIVGGTLSIPDARFTELSNAVGGGLIKDRILATGGRYDLAAAIARRMASVSGSDPDTVLVANGADPEKFFDPLALSPISAAQGFPIVLVSRDSIPGATQSVIDDFAPSTVIVGGGPLTVSDSVKNSLGALRWYGASRYTTATNIANNAISEGWLSDSAVGVAAMLPDALTGGGVIGRMGGVLLLTQGDTLTPETGAWIQTHKANITNCYVFGGPNSVSTAVVNAIKAKLQ